MKRNLIGITIASTIAMRAAPKTAITVGCLKSKSPVRTYWIQRCADAKAEGIPRYIEPTKPSFLGCSASFGPCKPTKFEARTNHTNSPPLTAHSGMAVHTSGSVRLIVVRYSFQHLRPASTAQHGKEHPSRGRTGEPCHQKHRGV